jgi:hypothetical protein
MGHAGLVRTWVMKRLLFFRDITGRNPARQQGITPAEGREAILREDAPDIPLEEFREAGGGGGGGDIRR